MNPPGSGLAGWNVEALCLRVMDSRNEEPLRDLGWIRGNANEDFVLVVVATVSTSCWPWAFRRELLTTTANGAVIVASNTTKGDIKGEALGRLGQKYL